MPRQSRGRTPRPRKDVCSGGPALLLATVPLCVGDYVQSCQVCQQYKVEQKAPAGHLGRRVIERPWQVVAGDIIGPLPRSSKGHEYVLVFQDLFTRWVEALAIRKANAKTVIEELNRRIFSLLATRRSSCRLTEQSSKTRPLTNS